jgi:ribosomal protein L11 methyltransferase
MGNDWTEISINTTTIVSELLSDFLIAEGSKGIVLGEWQPDNNSEYTTVKAYFPEDMHNISELLQKIHKKLDDYDYSGLNVGEKKISINLVKEEDWANSWKQYFHVIQVGKNLVIKPLWEEYQPKETDLVIDFDPGMAFGTGTHPSTRVCMEELEILAPTIADKENFNILDLGTGSGILTLVLSLFGFKKLTAVDNDPVAVRAAAENFRINNLKVNLFLGELKDCREEYDLIAGNLLAEIIESIAPELGKKVKPGGIFLGAGIIKQKEEDVVAALSKEGFSIENRKYFAEWVFLLCLKKTHP